MMRFLKAPTTALLLWLCASCSSSVLTDYPDDAFLGVDAFQNGEFQAAAQEFSLLTGTLGSNEFLAHAEEKQGFWLLILGREELPHHGRFFRLWLWGLRLTHYSGILTAPLPVRP